jgi:hypothetical protein
MNHIKLIVACSYFIICCVDMKAQTWFQDGDYWVYDYSTVWGRSGYEEVWVGGDTIIDGQACKVLNNRRTFVNIYSQSISVDTFEIVGDPFFVYEQSKKVYGYFEDAFKVLYDFSDYNIPLIIREGEGHPEHPDGCPLEIYFYATDSSSLVINNMERKVYQYESGFPYSSLYNDHDMEVIEGIGIVSRTIDYNNEPAYDVNFGHIIPGRSYPCSYDTERWNFCSFTSQGEIYNTENEDCFFLPTPVSSSKQMSVSSDIYIYPNPTSTYFSIRTSEDLEFDRIVLYDINGNLVKLLNQSADKIYTDDLVSGMYIVEVLIDGKRVYEKLIIDKK